VPAELDANRMQWLIRLRYTLLCVCYVEGWFVNRAPLLGTRKDMLSKALEWASVSVGDPLLGNMKGRSFLRAFEIKEICKHAL
jgi:hypothetical protein